MTADLRLRLNLTVTAHDALTGAVRSVQQTHNLVVSAGRNLVRDLLKGDSSATVTHFALGTSATAVAASDTTLVAEGYRDALTSRTAGAEQLACVYYLASGSGNGSTWREVGLLTASSGGTLYARALLAAPIVKTSALAYTFQWTLTFGV